ncbi:MAG: hypothetical protein JW910_03610 [Anaerolineae bacterium]|nr:hypothetical protein [Anaerolineae bacterium]
MDDFAEKYPPDPAHHRTTLLLYPSSYRDEAYANIHWVNGFLPYDVTTRRFDRSIVPPGAQCRWTHVRVGYFNARPGSPDSPSAQYEEAEAEFEAKLAELLADDWTVFERPDVIGARFVYLIRPRKQ